ncbi:hypothetical protein LRR80_05670 [Streptomyces sp. RO-S4]|uniref:hypothetical protein n=1 Tax=unclassified Streptomyces TaxID=2593676 RepID=UPI001E46437E|nr:MULTISPECIES: hypothetical protein [unclassified Streptomyces]MCO4699574.1 hypothetical protein [Streptomyces sp. RO-S4]MDU0303088.1 hypothetical protein [Streptomyces sp. PAL114]
MSRAAVGLMAGIALGFAAYFGNGWAFLLVLALGIAGLVIGRLTQGDLGPEYFVRRRDRQEWVRDDRRRARVRGERTP